MAEYYFIHYFIHSVTPILAKRLLYLLGSHHLFKTDAFDSVKFTSTWVTPIPQVVGWDHFPRLWKSLFLYHSGDVNILDGLMVVIPWTMTH